VQPGPRSQQGQQQQRAGGGCQLGCPAGHRGESLAKFTAAKTTVVATTSCQLLRQVDRWRRPAGVGDKLVARPPTRRAAPVPAAGQHGRRTHQPVAGDRTAIPHDRRMPPPTTSRGQRAEPMRPAPRQSTATTVLGAAIAPQPDQIPGAEAGSMMPACVSGIATSGARTGCPAGPSPPLETPVKRCRNSRQTGISDHARRCS
jgi:hypothetical protein